MTKLFHRTLICFLMEFLFEGFRTVTSTELYASYGEDILIASPHEEVQEWQFPFRNEILADCTNGKVEINLRLNRSKRLNITSNCSLLIQNLTEDDVGLYKCFRFDKDNSSKHTYEIYIRLRKLKIDEANDANLVQGTEGKTTALTCSLEGGSSNDMLHWITDNKTLTSGIPPSLKYTFMADQSDDKKEFTCRGIILTIRYFLMKKVTLNLYLKPKVFITVFSNSTVAKNEKNVIIRKGQHMELKCLEKYNTSQDIVILSWFFNGNLSKNNTNVLVLNNVNNEMAGQYICRAQNKVGRENDTVNITVAYKPETPRNFQVIALKFEMIVKWKAGKSDGMLQTFVIEYRKRFELDWIIVPAEGKTSTVIDGLQMNTVYFVRAFSETIGGKSNRTDDIIAKTGTHLVPHSCSLEIGIITSAAAVAVFFCLCGMIAFPTKRLCLNMTVNRHNGSQSNDSIPETRGPQYYEIDSMYYNPNNVNGRRELTLNNTQIEAPLSLGNNRNTDNITAENVGTGNFNQETTESATDSNIPSADNVSSRSLSSDSYLVPSRNYINVEISFTDTHSHQIIEPELLADCSSASNSESSETYIKSENQYETLASTNIVEHSYESTIETY